MKTATEAALKQAPDGKIHVIKHNKQHQFYLRTLPTEKNGTYISKSDIKTIKTYLQKQYDEQTLKLIKNEIKRLEAFVNTEPDDIKLQQLYSLAPDDIKALISPVDYLSNDSIKNWEKLNTSPSSAFPFDNETIYMTNKNERVRSKSEINIANALAAHNIPYKYEIPLILKSGKTVFPDFTIWNAKKRKEIYWEHRGLMDSIEYAKRAVSKTKEYQKSGIYLGDNLIITEETSNVSLGTDEIELIIKHYFL